MISIHILMATETLLQGKAVEATKQKEEKRLGKLRI
jgi:hypothetical protein